MNILTMTTKRVTLALVLCCFATAPLAKIFYSKNEALELAFGKSAQVETQSLFPDEAQTAKIQSMARITLESGMFSFYVGKAQDKVLGYAAIETNNVRTKPETLLILLNPEGQLQSIITLAFHEPPEYQPPERWYEQLYTLAISDMDFNKGVQGITGATLSTRSAINSVRKVLAMFEVMVKPGLTKP